MVGRDRQQVLRLARPLRSPQRAQWLGSPGLLAGGVGEAGDHRVPSEEPAGGLPAADLHDAGRRYRGGESGQRVAGVEPGGTAAQVESEALEEGDRLRATAAAASALAYRRELHQHRGDVLLLVQRAGWFQPLHRALGSARVDEGGRYRDYSPSRQGEAPRGSAADHLRQWPAIHRPGFQRVHPDLGHDACENLTLLSAIERKNRTLAQIAQRRMYSARNAADAGGCATADSTVCGSLQLRFILPTSLCG